MLDSESERQCQQIHLKFNSVQSSDEAVVVTMFLISQTFISWLYKYGHRFQLTEE